MASAYPNFDDISEKSESSEACVEPKDKPKQATDQLNEIKSEIKPDVTRDKAYIPDKLPKDFLRVMLNEQQVNEFQIMIEKYIYKNTLCLCLYNYWFRFAYNFHQQFSFLPF